MRTAPWKYLKVGIIYLWVGNCLLENVHAVKTDEKKFISRVKISRTLVFRIACSTIDHDYNVQDSRKLLDPQSCPSGGIVTAIIKGRIGNYISTYASLWAISRHTGLDPYAPPCLLAPLSILFAKLSIPSITKVKNCRRRWTRELSLESWHTYDETIILPPFKFYWDLIERYLMPIRKELLLDPLLREQAQMILTGVRKSYKNNGNHQVYVGVHIRRTDYGEHLRNMNRKPAPTSFYISAMAKFGKMFPRSLFIIVSDDPEWCRMTFKMYKQKKPVVVLDSRYYLKGNNDTITEKQPYVDFAVLAACNHTIYDYGTFGRWGALLAGGQVISYNISSKKGALGVINWNDR